MFQIRCQTKSMQDQTRPLHKQETAFLPNTAPGRGRNWPLRAAMARSAGATRRRPERLQVRRSSIVRTGMHRAQVRWPRGKGETRCQRRVGRLGHAGTCKSGRSRARPSVTMICFPIPPPPPSNPSMAGRRASCWQRSRSMRRSPTFSPVAPVAPALGGYRGSGHGTGARHPFDWSKPHRLARSTADLLRKPRPGPSRVCEPCRAHAFVC